MEKQKNKENEPYLAPYATSPQNSRGRLHKEEESTYRTVFQRDRDRIIHSTAFRRLEYKTQVFVNHEGDHYRTRLTHTLEVSQIARSISKALNLCEDLAEALALAHDIGHPPFGHAGENALDYQIKGFGGFDHNAQTIKILTQLEQRYAAFDGLNLTWEALEGIAKHNGPLIGKESPYHYTHIPYTITEYSTQHDLELDRYPSAEAQVAALSDDIAYHNHDIDDGLRAGLFSMQDLYSIPMVGDIFKETIEAHPNVGLRRQSHEAIRRLIDLMVGDVIKQTRANVENHNIQTPQDVAELHQPIVTFSEDVQGANDALKTFLYDTMYHHYRVKRMTKKAEHIVSDLFSFLYENPDCLPEKWRNQSEHLKDKERAIVVADYIAGMTDRYAIKIHHQLFDPTYQGI